ncbi:MAG: hypothetical protein KDA58_04220 [Planctomycetaceae bacterium]|nr:hypothetical protein [Planctomycetaceae bacterium]
MFGSDSFWITLLLRWCVVGATTLVASLLIGSLLALIMHGGRAPQVIASSLGRAFHDLVFLSTRRIGAIALLTFKEAYRRKAFAVGIVFLGIFMFGGWFLGDSTELRSVAPYISIVINSMWFMLVPMALLISCWGLPADVKERSIHTVVTKPVRRSEIVLGRMAGYGAVITLILFTTAVVGYFWVVRQVPQRLSDQLIARVPVYGNLKFLTAQGAEAEKGINVGDPWDYRSYIEGQTKARAIWKFPKINKAELKSLGKLPLEQRFEAFRTYKGQIDLETRFTITFVNPDKDLRVPGGTFPTREFDVGGRDRVIEIPEQITYRDSYEADAEEKTANLFDDLIADDGSLTIEVGCVEPQQYIGVNVRDLFIRMPDKSFTMNYVKAIAGLWLLVMLLVFLGTASSCFVKGPVATLLVSSLIIMGYFLGGHIAEQQNQMMLMDDGKTVIDAGGPMESLYRLVTKETTLPDNIGSTIIKGTDRGAFMVLIAVYNLVPDLNWFNTGELVATGFDISLMGVILPCLIVVLGYLIPLVILGYFSLQLRELEHK